MKKTILIVTAALLSLALNAASWTFTSIAQTKFYPEGQEAVNEGYWTARGTSSYYYKDQGTADELYVADGQKFAPTEGLKFKTRHEYFRVFFNGSGILLTNPKATGTNPSIVIPNCKAGSDLAITVKRNGDKATMAVSNALTDSLTLDGNQQTYTSMVLTDGDVVINMRAGAGYVRSIEVTPKSVYAAKTTKVVTLFEDNVTGVETTCTTRRNAKKYTIDGTDYNSVQAWTMGTSTNLTFRVKNAKKVTFVGSAAGARGFAISLNGAAEENITNSAEAGKNETILSKELTMVDDVVNIISITGVGGAVYPLAFIVEKDLEPIAPAMSGESIEFTKKDTIIYSGNIALSTVTNLTGADDQGFATASNIYLFTSSSAEGKTQALRVRGISTITIAAPSNYVIEKIGIRAVSSDNNERTITVNNANGENYGPVVENEASHYHEWQLATPSNHLEVSTNGMTYLIITLFGYVNDYYPLTISNNWASFCAAEKVELPDGLTAYRGIEGSNSDAVMLEEVEGNILPANQGFILGGANGSYNLTVTDATATASSNLGYTTRRTALPSGTIYCLNSDEGAFQLYEGAYIPANKAYYRIAPAGMPPRKIPMRIVQKDNTATAIENSEFIPLDHNAPVYNLQGQQVQITAPGIYIQNGHKYLIMK